MAQQRSVEVRVGIFVVICLLVGGWLVLQFGKYSPRGGQRYEIAVMFNNVGGLIPDSSVMYAGVGVGKVREIRLVEDGRLRARVRLAINEGVVIRQDARFVINQSGLLGDRYVDVIPQSATAPQIKPGDTLQGSASVDLTEVMRSVVEALHLATGTIERVNQSIERIDETVLNQRTLDHVSSTMANVDMVSSNALGLTASLKDVVEQNRGKVDATLTKVSDASENFRTASKHVDEAAARVDGLIQANQADIRTAVKNLAESTERLNTILTRLEKGEGTAGKILVDPTLHDEIVRLLQNWRLHGILYKEPPKRGPSRSEFKGGVMPGADRTREEGKPRTAPEP